MSGAHPDLRLAIAGEADAATLAWLIAELDDAEPMPVDVMRSMLAEIARHPGYTVYLLWAGDEAVASFSLNVFPVLAHQGCKEAIMESVVVARSHRGQGIGHTMMRHALALAREAGAYKLALSSNARRLEAHRFYRNLGFTQHGISFSIDLVKAAA